MKAFFRLTLPIGHHVLVHRPHILAVELEPDGKSGLVYVRDIKDPFPIDRHRIKEFLAWLDGTPVRKDHTQL